MHYYITYKTAEGKKLLIVTNNIKEMQDYVFVCLARYHNVSVKLKLIK